MTTIRSLIERLLAAVPDLRGVYDEHISDNDELLPHVFFGDVTRFAIENAAAPSVASLLALLDEALADADEEVREVVAASFVENLVGETAALKLMKPKMGLNLRRVFAAT
jgi:hypothetical protein|nr:hypothetical protein [uncultured Steroidobacter sp.]